MASPRSPDIFCYTSYRDYLRAWREARPANTYTRLAQRVGCAVSLVSNLLNPDPDRRRTMAPSYVQLFCDALELEGAEAEYFQLMVRSEDGATEAERQQAWLRLSGMKRFRDAHPMQADAYDYFAHWYHVAIRELAGCPGFRTDTAWLAKALQPRLSRREARKALDLLLRLGLLRQEGRHNMQQVDSAVRDDVDADPAIRGRALVDLTLWTLKRARRAIEHREYSAAERVYMGTTFAVPEARLGEAMELMHRFRNEMVELCEGDGVQDVPSRRDRVYRLQLLFFPMSQWVDRPDAGGSDGPS